jgi:chromosome segregation ATPase
MSLLGKLFGRGKGEKEVEQLRQRIAELESSLAFVSKKHKALAAQEGQPLHENAVLRYDLQKCQRDRQVLEWHVNGTRSELHLALGMLQRYEGSPNPAGRALIEAQLFFVSEARKFGVALEGLEELEAGAKSLWRQETGQEWGFDPKHLLALRCTALLAALHQREQQALDSYDSPAEAINHFDESSETLGPVLTAMLEQLRPAANPEAPS